MSADNVFILQRSAGGILYVKIYSDETNEPAEFWPSPVDIQGKISTCICDKNSNFCYCPNYESSATTQRLVFPRFDTTDMQNPTIPSNDLGVSLRFGSYHSDLRVAVYPVFSGFLIVLDTTNLESLIVSQGEYPNSLFEG